MKNSRISRVFSVLLAVCLLVTLCVTPAVAVSVWDGSSASESLSGAGTAADPYLIKTAEDLKFFADAVNGGTDYSGKVIYLQADIDLDNQVFTPIGSAAHYFRGQFDGKNHTVTGLNITTADGNGTGFFGGLHNGWIKNLHVEGSVINTYDSGNCNIGGIVGTTSGAITIFNCSFNGLIRSANTNVNRYFLAGGIVGGVNSTTTGGAKIDYCYSSGTIDAYGNAGGLVGALANDANNKLVITNSYSDALLTGSSAGTSTFNSAGTAAGLLGVMQNGTVTMTNCFFAGTAPYKRSSGYCGPVVNNKAGGTLTLTRVYYDNEKNLLNGGTFAAAVDGTGQTTDYMAYTLWGLFPNIYIAGTGTVKHPRFRLAEMGKGTNTEPYVVDSASDLKLISDICGTNNTYNFRDDFIVFGADVDLNNAAFTPIGSNNMFFRGNVDGKGHTVSNLSVTKSSTIGVGFFGAAGGTVIKNLNVMGTVTNNTSTGPVAGLVGKTSDTLYLTNCHFDGTVYASNNLVSNGSGGYSTNEQNNLSAGGLVCEAAGNVVIDRCSVSGTVDGFGRSGGLVSSLNGAYTVTVKNSYCDATVTGKGPVDSSLSGLYTAGGLIGFSNNGTMTLTNCFFAGTAPAARSNGMAGPIINHNAGGTFTCTRVYYLSDTAIETYGVNKSASEFANGTVTALLNAGNLTAGDAQEWWEQGTTHPVFTDVLFGSHSLVLADSIGINFFMDLSALTPEQKAASYMTFAVTNSDTELSADYDSGFVNATGSYHGFTCPLSSVQMAETVTPTYHYGDGETVTGAGFSVKNYIDYVVANSGSFDSAVVDLVKALGDYGHYIQIYLGTRNSWTAGTDYTTLAKYRAADFTSGDHTDYLAELNAREVAMVKSIDDTAVTNVA